MNSKYAFMAALAAVTFCACNDTEVTEIRAQLGEPCGTILQCADELVCVNNICAERKSDKAGLGEPCGDNVLCEDSLLCADNVCTDPSTIGQCTKDEDCTDAKCVSGICVPNQKVDCKNGRWEKDKCVCNENFKTDQSGICTLCVDGYTLKDGACVKNEIPQPPADECKATFYYTNEWTRIETGGEADFDVFLAGSFNANDKGEWNPTDDKYKMTYAGRGVHKISIDVKVGDSITYKYFVNGWGDDSWKTDPANTNTDKDGNSLAKIDRCGMEFGNKAGVDPVPTIKDCVHGKWENSACTCDAGYKLDGSGTCTECADGYVKDGDVCKIDKCLTTFYFFNQYTNKDSGGEADFDVYLVGDFNEWQKADPNYKMTSDKKGTHRIDVELEEGSEHKYKFYIDGWADNSWHSDPANPNKDAEGNSIAKISSCGLKFGKPGDGYVDPGVNPNPNPGGDVAVPGNNGGVLAAQPKVENKKITFEIKLAEGYNIVGVKGGAAPQFNGSIVTDTVKENNRYNYRVEVSNGSAKSEIYVPVWVEDKAFDWHDALLYFAFTDRFADGDSSNNNPKTNASVEGSSDARWMGGDFKGLKAKVEEGYFDRLGVNTLWISSVSMNTQGVSWGSGTDSHHSYSAYHSYWPITTFMTAYNQDEFTGKSEGVDITAIEPHFGTMEDLRALVDACHKRGIRVLVDFAANHVFKDSPMYKKHPEWFNGTIENAKLCDENGGWDKIPETCWFSKDLPDIDYRNADARRLMVDHAVWLIKETGVDGFRVDAVKHMAIEFIKDLRKATDAVFANSGIMFYMVGETFSGDANLLNKYIGDDLLHAQFDFQLYFQMSNLLKNGGMYSVATAGMYGNANAYKSDLMGTFIGNHDVARAISVAAGQNGDKWGQNPEVTKDDAYFRLKQALTILLTNPGVPLIYYGDEYGMVGANDPDNRRMMAFGSSLNDFQKSTLSYVQQLGTIRSEHTAITRGKRENINLENDRWCYKLTDGNETVIVGVAAKDKGGSCDLKGSYKLVDLLNPSNTRDNVRELNFAEGNFQIYLVK